MSQPIELSDKQSIAWYKLEDKTTTEILYGGAGGGGKSFLGCVWHIYRRTTYSGSRGLIGRNNKSDIKESTLVTLFNVANKMGYVRERDYNYNEQKGIITWSNGSKSIFKELRYTPSDPDFHSLGSTEYTDAFIEEGAEITEKAFEIISSRVRYRLAEFGLIPKTLITCNPNQGWIRKRYIKNELGEPIRLKPHQIFVPALVTDNPDKEFKDIYIKQLSNMSNVYDKQRLLHGDWDAREEIDGFATHFNRGTHVADVKLDIDKHLYTSKDFNLSPFACLAGHIWQDSKGHHCHIVDEFDIPKGSIEAMKQQYKLRYLPWLQTVKMTGDFMGTHKQISQSDNASHYEQLKRGLGLKSSQIITKPNPSHKYSRDEVNYILFHHPDFKISAKCERLIYDMENVQVDEHGQIMKRNRNVDSQRADYLDALRYYCHTFMRTWIDWHQKVSRK
jgi:phage terminase large subunit